MMQQTTQAERGATTTVAVLGGSGFTGGELLRLLLQHPNVDLVGATSDGLAGKPLHRAHPNLRGATDLRFTPRAGLPEADVVFSCAPHGHAARAVADLIDSGVRVVDLSADFRLSAPEHERWYGNPHPRPDLLERTVYGLPEVSRASLPGAGLVSGVGCLATAMNLALLPLARAGLLDGARVVVDGKVGSSAAGIETNPAGMHAARSRSLRLYAPTGHRHAAEVARVCGVEPDVSVHAVELVRGILATCHVLLPDGAEAPDDRALWSAYRTAYGSEPFVRVVRENAGVHRGPDPKLVAGSNLADVGFHVAGGRIVATCALDNLVKGAAGSAVQSMNVALGLPETAGLTQLPVHPQ